MLPLPIMEQLLLMVIIMMLLKKLVMVCILSMDKQPTIIPSQLMKCMAMEWLLILEN